MGAPTKTLRLLLVEEPDLRALEERLHSHEVFVADSFERAGDVLRRKTLDVVIADERRLEVLRLAARLQPVARRIMCGGDPPEQLERLLEKQTIHHFFSPGDPQLTGVLETLAGGPLAARPPAPTAGGAVEVRCESWSQFAERYAEDIKHGGLLIQTDSPPDVNTELEVRILLPDDHSLQLQARVVHVIAEGARPGVGVQLLDLDDERRREIQRLIELGRRHTGETAPGRTASQEAMLRRLLAEREALGQQDELAILGLDAPDPRAARRAFHRLSKRYHPDRFGKYEDAEIDRLATEIFIQIKRAFTRVSRTGTTQEQAAPVVAPAPAPPQEQVEAGPSFKVALRRIANEEYGEAQQELERILAQDGGNTEAQKWLYLIQARQLRRRGADREALAKYHAVLKLDARNPEAVEEVRAICDARCRAARPLGRPTGD
jgi:uncharacterized protein (TIGR02266 family)